MTSALLLEVEDWGRVSSVRTSGVSKYTLNGGVWMFAPWIGLADQPSRQKVGKVDGSECHFRVENRCLKHELIGSNLGLLLLDLIQCCLCTGLEGRLKPNE